MKSWRYDVIVTLRRQMKLWRHMMLWRQMTLLCHITLWHHMTLWCIMALWRHHKVMTSSWRYDFIVTLWRHHDLMTSSRRYDVIMMTSYDIRFDVIRRSFDLIWRYDLIMIYGKSLKVSYIFDNDLHPCFTTHL